MGGHVFRLAYLTGGCVLLVDMSNRRTGCTEGYVLWRACSIGGQVLQKDVLLENVLQEDTIQEDRSYWRVCFIGGHALQERMHTSPFMHL